MFLPLVPRNNMAPMGVTQEEADGTYDSCQNIAHKLAAGCGAVNELLRETEIVSSQKCVW